MDIRSASVPAHLCIYFYTHHIAVGYTLHQLQGSGPASLHLGPGLLLVVTFQERINEGLEKACW